MRHRTSFAILLLSRRIYGLQRFNQRSPRMSILGAHMSIAGGYYKSVEAAAKCEMDCVQLFTNLQF